ncbi:MAG: ABC transporter permease [Gemmatimonadota bacterium]
MSRIAGSRIIDAIAPLVPADCREEWRAEWQGEVAAAAQDPDGVGPFRIRLRCLGAISDALWHRRRYREPLAMSQNLKYALRLMGRRPAFSAIVILTLALGIGGTTAIYSVVNAVLLRSLPYPKPEQLYVFWGMPTDGDVSKVGRWTSYLDYKDYQAQDHSFTQMAAYRQTTVTLTTAGADPRFVENVLGTANTFSLLAVEPVIGRLFSPEEEAAGSPDVAVLSYSFWRARFGADPKVLGTIVQLDGRPFTIVGVLPERFRIGSADLWSPLVPGRLESNRGNHTLRVIGRLRPGVTPESAALEAKAVAAALEKQYPDDNAKRSVRIEPLKDATVRQTRPFLLALMGGVTLVLLIVCTNVANLFLVRAAARDREIAVRTALGAGRGTLFNQFLTESLLLTLIGAVLGLPLAYLGVRLLLQGAPESLPRLTDIGIDPTALGFMLTVSLLAGLLFGVVPAAYSSRHSIAQGIRERGTGPRHGRLSRGFVVTEIALAGILVIGAALLGKSLWRLNQVDLRFNPENLLVAKLQLPSARYPGPDDARSFFGTLTSRVAAEPGVRSVSLAYQHPLSDGWTSSFILSELPHPKLGEEPEAQVRPVSPGYFHDMGVALIKGRDFTPGAGFDRPGEVIVNQAFVKQKLLGQEPLGKHIERSPWWPGQPGSWEIIGVVADEPFRGLGIEADPATYFAHGQLPMNEMYLLVRTAGDPVLLREVVRRDVAALDRDLPLESIPTMNEILSDLTAVPRFNVQLIGLFAVVALLLAALGVYGVLAQMVTQRTAEIGIRMALGADKGSVLRMVVGQGVRLSLVGVFVGLVLASGATQILESQLYAVTARDPSVFIAAGLGLILVAGVAAYIPARRASRVSPIEALKAE